MREQDQQEDKGLALSAASVSEGLLLAARWHARAGRQEAAREALAEAGRVASDVAEALHQPQADAPAKPPPTTDEGNLGGEDRGQDEDRSQDELAIGAVVRAQMALFTQVSEAEAYRVPDDEAEDAARQEEEAEEAEGPSSTAAKLRWAFERSLADAHEAGVDLLGMLADAYKRQG